MMVIMFLRGGKTEEGKKGSSKAEPFCKRIKVWTGIWASGREDARADTGRKAQSAGQTVVNASFSFQLISVLVYLL